MTCCVLSGFFVAAYLLIPLFCCHVLASLEMFSRRQGLSEKKLNGSRGIFHVLWTHVDDVWSCSEQCEMFANCSLIIKLL